jgi:hypothetical protein
MKNRSDGRQTSAENRDFSKIENMLKVEKVPPQRCLNQAEVLIEKYHSVPAVLY